MKKLILLLVALSVTTSILVAQDLKKLTVDDYGKWSRLVATQISDNGEWMSYGKRPNGGDDTLIIRDLVNVDSPKEYKVYSASNAQFSSDSKWVSYLVSPDSDEEKKLKKAKKPVYKQAVLVNLVTGEKKVVERASTMTFSNDAAMWVVHRQKPSDDKSSHKGSDLVLFHLPTANTISLGNVSEYGFNQKSSHLAYLVDADDQIGNGAYLLAANKLSSSLVHADSAKFTDLTWDDSQSLEKDWAKKGNSLSFLKSHKIDTLIYPEIVLGVAQQLDKSPKLTFLNPKDTEAIASDMVISVNATLRFTANGEAVFLGLRKQEPKIKMSKDTIPNLDVWHWKDDRIQTVQIRQAARDKRFSYRGIFHVNQQKFVALADENMREVLTTKSNDFAVGMDFKPYINDVNWGVSPADMYKVDLTSGKRSLFAQNIKRSLGTSPDGRYFLYQKMDEDGSASLMVYDITKETTTQIDEAAGISFENEDHIYPHENPPYGLAGWTADKEHVIMNHKFDLWLLSLDGKKAQNLTKGMGEANEMVFRVVNLDDEDSYVNTKNALLLSATGEWTKKEGFYSVKVGKEPQMLVYSDYKYSYPTKAKDADKLLLSRQTFVDYQDYYLSNSSFKTMDKVTEANPQQAEYAWGSRKLLTFENGRGQKVQGTLTLPANYVEGQSYPTIIYFYEKMSDRHHRYEMPVYDDRPHMSTYASNGYVLFQPDILFEEGKAGTSSLDGITAAVDKIVADGYADPERIGLQGHSWGGYQSSFILTQTDIFKTVVTGAPPTNLTSFYNNVYGSSGTNHHGIMEIGQVRMGRGVTPWTHREIYQKQNPMFYVPEIKIPFMILHGTEDGAVDWSQGLEFYNAARRMGKEVIFLSYPGEGHHLSNKANQKDFLVRMHQYFDYHLKGVEPADWITNGVPHLEKLYEKAE